MRCSQAAAGGLLQGGGGERRRRGFAALPHLHPGHPVRGPGHGLRQGLGLGLGPQVEPSLFLPLSRPDALPLRLEEERGEGLPLYPELPRQGPVLLLLEGLDLLLPLRHEPQGHALDAACGEGPFAELQGEEGGEVVAEKPVQDPPRLLGVHQVLVDGPGPLHRFPDHLRGDLVELHPDGLLGVAAQKPGHMPANGLPFPVGVGGDEEAPALGGPLELLHHGLLVLFHLVGGSEVPRHVHPQLPLGKVRHVAPARPHLVARPQHLLDAFGLAGDSTTTRVVGPWVAVS